MQITNNQDRYGVVAQTLHWAIVALIIAQFLLANKAADLPLGVAKINTLAQHKSIGITILALAIVRLIWRWCNPIPSTPAGVPAWQRVAGRISHTLLYVLLLALPVVGWLMSSARSFSVSWFGWVTLPDLIGRNEAAFQALRNTHEILAKTLFIVAVVHMAAALKHHFIDKDDVLARMIPALGEDKRRESTARNAAK